MSVYLRGYQCVWVCQDIHGLSAFQGGCQHTWDVPKGHVKLQPPYKVLMLCIRAIRNFWGVMPSVGYPPYTIPMEVEASHYTV